MQTEQSLTTQQTASTPKTWKPTTAGILDIIVAGGTLLGSLLFLIAAIVLANGSSFANFTAEDLAGMSIGAAVAGVMAAVLAGLGVLELIAGIYAIRRKNWGLALAGSIVAALPFEVLGILALIFVAMGKNEFD